MFRKSHKFEWLTQILLAIGVFGLYLVNSFLIKPIVDTNNSVFEYLIANQLNDYLCPIFICGLFGFMTAIIRRVIVFHWLFYLVLFIVSAIVWEVLRPYILTVVNIFNKVAHFKWGDFVAYFLGYLSYYLGTFFRFRKYEKVRLKEVFGL